MSALNSLLGTAGDPPMCKIADDASVHWWPTDAVPGDPCLCGVLPMRSYDPLPAQPCGTPETDHE